MHFRGTFRRAMSGVSEGLIQTTRRPNALTIALNRPKALNALTLDMCAEILDIWRSEEARVEPERAACIVVKGQGKRAFCAGGDVKAIYQEIVEYEGNDLGSGRPGHLHSDFFRKEYEMNYKLATSKIPQLSLWDGIVMGGGVGLSAFGRYRICHEKTIFAMPETAIGIFPDVGSSSWLPHLPYPGMAQYIGLTGVRLGAADLLTNQIATHFIPSVKMEAFEQDVYEGLAATKIWSQDGLDSLVTNLAEKHCSEIAGEIREILGESITQTHRKVISECFGGKNLTMDRIYDNLQRVMDTSHYELHHAWAAETTATLRKMSPSSLVITLSQLRRGECLSVDQCLKMEYRAMMNCLREHDFREGVRALLVDKDGKPQWQPAISHEKAEEYFRELDRQYELQCV
jgi:enoyl-CoA hydratase/carnithine racemase